MDKNTQQSLDIKAQAYMSRLKIEVHAWSDLIYSEKEKKNKNYNIFIRDKFQEKQAKLF